MLFNNISFIENFGVNKSNMNGAMLYLDINLDVIVFNNINFINN